MPKFIVTKELPQMEYEFWLQTDSNNNVDLYCNHNGTVQVICTVIKKDMKVRTLKNCFFKNEKGEIYAT